MSNDFKIVYKENPDNMDDIDIIENKHYLIKSIISSDNELFFEVEVITEFSDFPERISLLSVFLNLDSIYCKNFIYNEPEGKFIIETFYDNVEICKEISMKYLNIYNQNKYRIAISNLIGNEQQFSVIDGILKFENMGHIGNSTLHLVIPKETEKIFQCSFQSFIYNLHFFNVGVVEIEFEDNCNIKYIENYFDSNISELNCTVRYNCKNENTVLQVIDNMTLSSRFSGKVSRNYRINNCNIDIAFYDIDMASITKVIEVLNSWDEGIISEIINSSVKFYIGNGNVFSIEIYSAYAVYMNLVDVEYICRIVRKSIIYLVVNIIWESGIKFDKYNDKFNFIKYLLENFIKMFDKSIFIYNGYYDLKTAELLDDLMDDIINAV